MTPSDSSPQPGLTLSTLPITTSAVIVSCLFSALVILQNPLLNDDAYGYLRAADSFNANGMLAVLQTYSWYNYSILVALLDRVLPGGMIAAAHVFGTACHALLTWAFIQVSGELRASRRVQIFSALCILGLPLVNEMRYFLIRDTGFWAFALLSLWYFLRYSRTGHARTGLYWCLSLCAASAFRLEGLLLMFAPLTLLLPCPAPILRERALRCALLLGLMAATLTCVFLATLLAGINLIELIAYAYRHYLPLLADLITPGNLSGTDAGPGFPSVLFGDAVALLTNLVNALSVPLVVLMLTWRFLRGPLVLPQYSRRALQAYAAIALLALVLFVLIMHFLTQRYMALLSLLLLLLVPLMLDDLYTQALQKGTLKRFHTILAVFCFYYLVDGLVSFGYSQRHVDDGIAWARSNLPAATQIRTNNFALAYHSGHVTDYDKTVRDTSSVVQGSSNGDYLLLEVDHDDDTAMLDSNPALQLVTRFANERGDEVRVYQYRQGAAQ